MSGQQIGAVIGGAIGAYFGGPAGAQLGMAIGGAIGGAVDPTEINGPHIGDGQQQSATDGSPIAWVMGTAKVAGTTSWVGERFEVKIKDSGKGGPEVSHYESRQSFAICVCESSELKGGTIESVLMVEQDGVIVYDMRPGSTMVSDSQKWAENIEFMFGAEDQQPHPTIEAKEGVGNTPAYRGRLMMVATDFDIYSAGDRIPNFTFLVSSTPTPVSATSGTAGWPAVRDIPLPDTGKFTLDWATGAAPDCFEVWVGGEMVLRTGWYGNPSFQNQLNSTLDQHELPREEIITATWPHPDPPSGSWDDNYPELWDSMEFYKSSSVPSITLRVYSVSPSGWEVKIRYGSGAVALSSIVERICERGGLDASALDASLLTNQVIGYPIARQTSAADALRPLLQAYFAFGSEYDGKIRFEFFGGDAPLTVNPDHLIIGNDAIAGALQETVRNQATEFPRKTIGRYTDPDQNYNVVTVMAERNAVDVVAIGEQQFDMPVVMQGDEARKAVDKALKVAYASLEGTREYVVPYSFGGVTYLSAYAGMPVIMDDKRWVIDDMTIGTNFLKFATRYDRQSAYTSRLQAVKGVEPTPPISRYGGPTDLLAMNLPILRSKDSVGLYLVAKGHDKGWRRADVEISYDDKESWEPALTINLASIFGSVVNTLPSAGEPLEVDVGGGELESITQGQLDGGANAFAVVHGSDQGSVAQFMYADMTSDETWELTGIVDALKGSAALNPAIGDAFALLENAYFLPVDESYAGKTLWLRATANGEKPDEQTPISIVYHPDTDVYIDGGTPGDGLPPPVSGDV